ncbi:uncharacterized protein BO96DRAFT_10554 [Aspergillus niger CBS 101883]|uniref:uncharacterized protein n=1 Tax=Aspergillus lacticoffeatus (strain CBS 101883) TaxID=1450533 RepID=UPI000D7F44DA|nr:uncharacterized protein BO96DRAFT_10554 [Aspergillus niger CBS 101883]PYH62262.1 hypothetical protein BO96DRAFT_10554 [Aspergillus niger CBS 101883]
MGDWFLLFPSLPLLQDGSMYLSVGAWALLIYPPIDRQSGWLAPKPFTTTRGTPGPMIMLRCPPRPCKDHPPDCRCSGHRYFLPDSKPDTVSIYSPEGSPFCSAYVVESRAGRIPGQHGLHVILLKLGTGPAHGHRSVRQKRENRTK